MAVEFTSDFVKWTLPIDITGRWAFSVTVRKRTGSGRRVFHLRQGNAGLQLVTSSSGGGNAFIVANNNGGDCRARWTHLANNDQWYHLGATSPNTTSVDTFWMDGVASTDSTGSNWNNGSSGNGLTVGARNNNSQYLVGDIAALAFWEDYTPTTADMQAMAAGAPFWLFAPDNLDFYWACEVHTQPALIGNAGFSPTGTKATVAGAHPIMPQVRYIRQSAAPPVGAKNYYLGGNAMNRGKRGFGWAA